jgi:plasmid stabilization system protein ParE
MTYRIEISPTAMADVEGIFLWMKGDSIDQAHRWVRGCYEIMLTLENFPNRCPLAIESQYLNYPIRQLLYKKHYRILFSVRAGDDPIWCRSIESSMQPKSDCKIYRNCLVRRKIDAVRSLHGHGVS